MYEYFHQMVLQLLLKSSIYITNYPIAKLKISALLTYMFSYMTPQSLQSKHPDNEPQLERSESPSTGHCKAKVIDTVPSSFTGTIVACWRKASSSLKIVAVLLNNFVQAILPHLPFGIFHKHDRTVIIY